MDHTEAAAPLNAAAVCALRDSFGQLADVEVVAETASTNADLMARLASLQQPLLRVAVHQSAGRGRAGRAWHSVAGGVLTFSLAWPMPQTAQALTGLPLAVGVALAEALNQLGVLVQLKWPNDILRDGKKLAGILLESAVVGKLTWVVVGVGLNLQVPDALESVIGQRVADAPWLAQMDRNDLLARLLNALALAMQQFQQYGFKPFLARWNALHAHAGQEVVLLDHGQILQRGVALGVDLAGCLVLQTEQGQVSVLAGDVSLRGAAALQS